nr:MAG TPA: hypothetical protein [Bacteriophage sp.]
MKIKKVVLIGGLLSANANNGANAGFGYLNTNNRSSNANANNGFRLYRSLIKYNLISTTLPHRSYWHC